MGVGIIEMMLVLGVGCITLVLRRLNVGTWRWMFVITLCLAVATPLTPPDALSTILGALLLFGAFSGGVFSSAFLRPSDGVN
jgi:Sec-independent protein secretion pathway component TatC